MKNLKFLTTTLILFLSVSVGAQTLNNANLRDLSVANNGLSYTSYKLTPNFSPDITEYTLNLPYLPVINMMVIGFSDDANAKVNNEIGLDVISTKDLLIGDNIFTFIVTARDGVTQKTYTVTINYTGPSSNANLSKLGTTEFELTPSFSSDITKYTISVPYLWGKSICITGSKEDSKATLNQEGCKNLQVGENLFIFTVTAEDGVTVKTYTVVVTREAFQEREEIINIIEPGTLNSSLFTDLKSITKLTLTGTIDARDIYFLESLKYLPTLDLSNTNIVEYEGATRYSPREGKFYPANELPDHSLSYLPLTSVILPKSLTSIGNYVLCGPIPGTSYKATPTSLDIPEGVTKIGNDFAQWSDSLTTVILPSTLIEVGRNSFSDCNNISVVINFNPNSINIAASVFASVYGYGVDKNTCILYVPAGSKSDYEGTDIWKDFKNIVELPTLTEITETPTIDGALIEWQAYENAEGYRIIIYSDEVHTNVICVLEFDAMGNLLRSADTKLFHSIENLFSGTDYYYTFEILGVNNVVLASQSGEFTTAGEPTDIVETQCIASLRSVIGYYSIMGIKLSEEPESGLYIILYSNGQAEKIIKK